MYIILLLMLSHIGLEAHKWVYNTTENPIVIFTRDARDTKTFKPTEFDSYDGPRYRFISIKIGSQVRANSKSHDYDTYLLKWTSRDGDRVLVVESDSTDESGLKAHTISKEEFDKKYKGSVAGAGECPTFPVLPGAPGGPAFPQEERKASAAKTDE